MTAPVTIRERHNSYGVLCTVLGLMIAVVFAGGNYDEWDAVISLFSLVFSVSFVLRVRDVDWFETVLISFLAGLSIATLVSSLLAWASHDSNPFAIWLDGVLLEVSIGLALLVVLIGRILRKVMT